MVLRDFKETAEERRQHPRVEVLNPAKILMAGSQEPMICIIIDWSHGGARLRPYDPNRCPKYFTLLTQDGTEDMCEVVWRRDGEVGVKFGRGNQSKK